MLVSEAQREIRTVYAGGSIGQMVSGLLWLVSTLLGTFLGASYGVISLFFGGFLIFPLTQLALKLAGRPASVSKGNPLEGLARQVAFIAPLGLPVVAAATLHNINWFYPAFMVVVGAHYLPFVFLYGMREYAILAGLLWFGGVGIGMYLPDSFTLGGWFTAVILLGFGIFAWITYARGVQEKAEMV